MNLFKEKPTTAIITIPNIITVTGILLIIPYVWGFLMEYRWVMFISLFLSGCSDLFDGLLARKLKQCTKLGEMIDPLRDRFLFLAEFINFIYVFIGEAGKNINRIFALAAGSFFTAEMVILFFDYYWWKNKILKARNHGIRKFRQASLLLIIGTTILNHYFSDIISEIIGSYQFISLGSTLIMMAIISSITLLFYWRLWKELK